MDGRRREENFVVVRHSLGIAPDFEFYASSTTNPNFLHNQYYNVVLARWLARSASASSFGKVGAISRFDPLLALEGELETFTTD
jgi:hypothetical protein